MRNEKFFDAFQSLQILRSCVSSTIDCVNQEIVESIWTELRKKSEINEEHYMQLMRYYECIKKSDEIIKLFEETCALRLKLRTFVLNSDLFGNYVFNVLSFDFSVQDISWFCVPIWIEKTQRKLGSSFLKWRMLISAWMKILCILFWDIC